MPRGNAVARLGEARAVVEAHRAVEAMLRVAEAIVID